MKETAVHKTLYAVKCFLKGDWSATLSEKEVGLGTFGHFSPSALGRYFHDTIHLSRKTP